MFRTSHGQHEGYDWVNNSNKNHSVKPAINPLLCLHHNNWNLNLFVLVARSNFNIFYGHFIFPRIFSNVFFSIPPLANYEFFQMFLFHPAIGQLSVFTLAINPLFCLKHNSWNLYIFLAFLHGKRCPEALVLVARSNSEINHEVQWSKFNISTFPICIFYSLNFFQIFHFHPATGQPIISVHFTSMDLKDFFHAWEILEEAWENGRWGRTREAKWQGIETQLTKP